MTFQTPFLQKRFWLVLFTLVAMASSAKAWVVGITACNCTNLTVAVDGFANYPSSSLTVMIGGWSTGGGVLVPSTFSYASQTIVLTRPGGLAGGSYWIKVFLNNVLFANNQLTVCDCVPCDCTGATGPKGATGPAGPKGATGATGLAGPAGPAGARGSVGPPGLHGIKGDTGAMGLRGSIGPVGPMGPAGTNEFKGTNGGPAGPIGLTGATGPAGPQGSQGINGANGTSGPAGPIGQTGVVGPAGATGPAGAQGPQGINGANGASGPAGPIGLTGATGSPGIDGTNGINGTTGSGSSEYGYIYNLFAQVVPLEADVTFSDNGIGTSGIAHALGGSGVMFAFQGNHKVTFSVSGAEPNQFALCVNGVVIAESVYGSGAGTQQNNGQAILAINANDVLTLRNHTSAAAVTLAATPPIGGTAAAVNASILIQKLD